ncbi:MAG: integral rane sensor signal transduction histidine kinase [Pedosphaera sp.]|nr:integral rane sensor signal transduction histidine kinase [Pedosphaera sp.]
MTLNTLPNRPRHSTTGWVALLLLLVCGNCLTAASAVETLTNASDILTLSAAEALSGIPISVQGIVTAAETNWNGRFFVQDSSGGVFVENLSAQQPAPGDLVAVSGISHPGGYAPIITKPHWTKLGTAPLPLAKPVTIERLMSGTEDSQRVEISGIVRTAQIGGDRLGIELASGGYRLRAYSQIPPNLDPQSLVGAKVLLKGTAATAFNAPLRHFVTVTLFIPQFEDFTVNEPAPANLFGEPLIPLNSIAQYRENRSPGNQVHVKGFVTYQRKGEELFLQDATGGIRVKSKLAESFSPGDVIEAVGFPAVENFLPVLEDAVFRQTTEPRVGLKPQPATAAELLRGLHHAGFVTLQGRLIDRLVKGVGQSAAESNIRTTLVLQSSNFLFTAEKETADQSGFLASLPIGSLVEVSGICLLESSDAGKTKSIRLLLPSADDIHIIEKPSWLTPQHLRTGLVIISLVLLVAIGWTVMVSKKNSILKSLVREKEAAQGELQQAHDQLEERVRERTAQLKIEMTARKESELQFRAVLTERTRLAQELHDTSEQTMTGIALQLDMVANHFERNPDNASRHLKLARNLMRQSQVDMRRSVWGLRSRAAEEFTLTNAVMVNSQQIVGGAGIQVQVETVGEASSLSEIAEENLLRICQEAVTNVVKHSGAKLLKIELNFSPQKVVLEIKDNGKGFAPAACAGPKDGHFGLLGITERAERLGGHALITSAAGVGTTIHVEIPTQPPNGN